METQQLTAYSEEAGMKDRTRPHEACLPQDWTPAQAVSVALSHAQGPWLSGGDAVEPGHRLAVDREPIHQGS